MRKTAFLGALVAVIGAGPAASQIWIGQVVGNLTARGNMKWCYDGSAKHDAKYFAGQTPYADRAMDKYLGLARNAASLDKMFTGTRDHRLMLIDGVADDPRTAHDPWAAQIARLDALGHVLSNDRQNIHGQWRAVAANGAALGIYDVLLRAGVGGYHIRQIRLLSPAAAAPLSELKAFCIDPGDIEQWQEAQAKREAEKAAKRADR